MKQRYNINKTLIGIILISVFMMSSSIPIGYAQNIIEDDINKTIFKSEIIVPDDFPTIQQAINHAIMGSTIKVRRGEYKESIQINKMISLVGSGSSGTIITGSGHGDVVKVTVDGVSISGFTIQNSGEGYTGIRLDSHYNIINQNQIINNGHGIVFYASSGNIVLDNVVENNMKAGFWFYRSHANTINGNELKDNNDGMLVNFSCLGNQVKGNIFSSNKNNGLQLSETSRSNTFIANSINKNENNGVKVIGSSDSNNFHHNDLIQNTQNAFDTSTNHWNDSAAGSREGNHWSDYEGVDSDGDGVGDTPYFIPGKQQFTMSLAGNQDNFPLMEANTPTQIKIEVLNIHQLIPNTAIEFEISYRQIMQQITGIIDDEDIYCQIDWDDQSIFTEHPMQEDGFTITHSYVEEGSYKVRIRSFRYVVGERYNSEWFNLQVKLSDESSNKNGFLLFPSLSIDQKNKDDSIGYQASLTGLGILKPDIMIKSICTKYYDIVETENHVQYYKNDGFFPIFLWINKVVDERYFTDVIQCDISVILYVNGQLKDTVSITITP